MRFLLPLMALAFVPALARAQEQPDRVQSNVQVIAATGFARDDVVGYHGLLGIESRTPISRFHARVEALFADFGAPGHTSAAAFTITAAALPGLRGPYFLASYATSDSVGWQRGWSVGLGWRFRVGDRNAFLESRMLAFHDPAVRGDFDEDWRYLALPISLGLRF